MHLCVIEDVLSRGFLVVAMRFITKIQIEAALNLLFLAMVKPLDKANQRK